MNQYIDEDFAETILKDFMCSEKSTKAIFDPLIQDKTAFTPLEDFNPFAPRIYKPPVDWPVKPIGVQSFDSLKENRGIWEYINKLEARIKALEDNQNNSSWLV